MSHQTYFYNPKFDKKLKKKGKKLLRHADNKDYESSKSSSSMEEPEEMKARVCKFVQYTLNRFILLY